MCNVSPWRHHQDCAYAQPSMYSISLNTKPVKAIPASVASSRGGSKSGSRGMPTSTRAMFAARPSCGHTVELTITLPRIAGYRRRSLGSSATPRLRIGVTSTCKACYSPILISSNASTANASAASADSNRSLRSSASIMWLSYSA